MGAPSGVLGGSPGPLACGAPWLSGRQQKCLFLFKQTVLFLFLLFFKKDKKNLGR